MPRGQYPRKKTPTRKSIIKKIRQSVRRSKLLDKVDPVEDSEFLKIGTTHSRERQSKVSALEQDYFALLNQADILADHIEKREPIISQQVVDAYKAIKHRKLTHF